MSAVVDTQAAPASNVHQADSRDTTITADSRNIVIADDRATNA
jgi:hypothetical protein